MNLSRATRVLLRVATLLGMAFIYVPLVLILVNSFNASSSFHWPPSGLTTRWWSTAFGEPGIREALLTSVRAGLGATALALVLGTLAALAVVRYEFFGRQTVSLLLILPIALPGIVTGIALNTAFVTVLTPLGIGFGLFTVVLGHTTFCIVVVFNNVAARLRRLDPAAEQASADLGAHTFQTFWRITLPTARPALVAGGLLAFALSFDEIVVTTFTAGPGTTTLPIWIFENLNRPHQAPVVDVVAAVLIAASVLPVYLAQRLSADSLTGSL